MMKLHGATNGPQTVHIEGSRSTEIKCYMFHAASTRWLLAFQLVSATTTTSHTKKNFQRYTSTTIAGVSNSKGRVCIERLLVRSFSCVQCKHFVCERCSRQVSKQVSGHCVWSTPHALTHMHYTAQRYPTQFNAIELTSRFIRVSIGWG